MNHLVTLGERLRWPALVALLALAGLFLDQTWAHMQYPNGNDLTVYLLSARALAHGQNPYATGAPQGFLPYPLTLAAAFIPLTWVPTWAAQTIWFLLNVAALVVSLRLLDAVWRSLSPGESRMLGVPFVARVTPVVLALLRPLRINLVLGQVNLMLVWLCCAFFRADARRRWPAASLWLGAAIATKLTPLVLVVGILRDRRYRVAVATAAAVLLWALVLPALVSDRAWALYRDVWAPALVAPLRDPVGFDRQTRFTLAATLAHLWPGLAGVPGFRVAAALAVLAPVAWLQGRVGRDARLSGVVFVLYLTAMPLISPLSETHHLSVLLGPLWIWLLLAGDDPTLRRLDLAGAAGFLRFQWLVTGRSSVADFLALAIVYAVLFLRGLGLATGATTVRGRQTDAADPPGRARP